MKIVVSLLPELEIISPSASTSSLSNSASTRTASAAPMIDVAVVGENVRSASPAIIRVGLVNARRWSEGSSVSFVTTVGMAKTPSRLRR